MLSEGASGLTVQKPRVNIQCDNSTVCPDLCPQLNTRASRAFTESAGLYARLNALEHRHILPHDPVKGTASVWSIN
jgi:hypothetical protein